MSSTEKPIANADLTVEAGIALAKGRFVTYQGAKWQYPAAGGLAIGVMPLRRECESGSRIGIRTLGICNLKLGSGGASIGTELASDSSGQGVAAGSADYVNAIAIEAGSEGDLIDALVVRYKLETT